MLAVGAGALGLRGGEVVLLAGIAAQIEQAAAPGLDLVDELPRAVPQPELQQAVVGEEARDRLARGRRLQQRAALPARRRGQPEQRHQRRCDVNQAGDLRRGARGSSLYRGGGVDVVPTLQERLFTPQFRHLYEASDALAQNLNAEVLARKPDADFLTQIAYFEFRHRLPELLLMRMDKISMAHGLEARVPFLDHRLVEYTMTLPENVKVPRLEYAGGETKHLLKRAVENVLPHDIIYRKKQGFAAPVNEWFRKPLKTYWESEVLSSRLVKDGIFDRKALESVMQRHASGKRNDGKSLYALLNLALWHKQFIG